MKKWKHQTTRWWFQTYFSFSPLTLGKIPYFLTMIFFRWVELQPPTFATFFGMPSCESRQQVKVRPRSLVQICLQRIAENFLRPGAQRAPVKAVGFGDWGIGDQSWRWLWGSIVWSFLEKLDGHFA